MDSVIVTVYLQGVIGGCVKHTNRQKSSFRLGGKDLIKVIKHTDREVTQARRIFTVSSEFTTIWAKEDLCPYWEKPKDWKGMSPTLRVESHLKRFDEGFGVDYEFLDDSED